MRIVDAVKQIPQMNPGIGMKTPKYLSIYLYYIII